MAIQSLIGAIPDDGLTLKDYLLNAMDGIVTRNPSDYKETSIPIRTPESLLDVMEKNESQI